MKRWKNVLIPFVIIAAAGAAYASMLVWKKPLEIVPERDRTPSVVVVQAIEDTVTLMVRSQGTVQPRTQTTLSSEVTGKIVRTAPYLQTGGFFHRSDLLIEIDDADYRAAVARAEAELAGARIRLASEEALKVQAEKEWKELGESAATPLALHVPQVNEARALVRSAEEELKRAQAELGRTRIRAPYTGMVRGKSADIGQYVTPGIPLATVCATDVAEVRLPVSGSQTAFLDLDEGFRGHTAGGARPKAILSADLAGVRTHWRGSIVRSEGCFDPCSRLLYVVAQVTDPYGIEGGGSAVPLRMGMFVEATITGRTIERAVVVPPRALRDPETVLVVDGSDRLTSRKVDVLRVEDDRIIIRDGLRPGECVCVTSLDFVSEGMPVRVSIRKEDEGRRVAAGGGRGHGKP